MQAVENDDDWHLIARTTGKPVGEPIKARELLREISEAAWRCATRASSSTRSSTTGTPPEQRPHQRVNPCSEYMHVDDSACNLASLNLMKFRRPDGTLDVKAYEHRRRHRPARPGDHRRPSSYPTPEIGENARAFRQLGLGYANLGAYLMANGLPYDSDEGPRHRRRDHALMTGRAYRQSAELAKAVGPYEHYEKNREPHNAVMRKHRDAAYAIDDANVSDKALLAAARKSWDEAVELGEQHGYRNAQATVLAPTGTISFLMDCDTTGIEPDFSLVKYKELVGGGSMTIVNRTVPSPCRPSATSRRRSSRSRRTSTSTARSSAPPASRASTCRCSTSRSASARSRRWAT